MNRSKFVFVFSSLFVLLGACSQNLDRSGEGGEGGEGRNEQPPELPTELANYANPPLPAHFSVETEGFHGQQALLDTDNTPAENLTTNAGATLGRVLFYDGNLSKNHTISCASCHKAELGFSDDRVLSKGFENGDTGRHSMGLVNARFYRQGKFFWDQRAATLEDQVLMPFQDQVEMGMTLDGVVERVKEAEYYPDLFTAAFGSPDINAEKISQALAQFVRSIVSYTSKYDEGRAMVSARSDSFPNFSEQENRGKTLFIMPPPRGGFGCFVCHQGEGFVAASAQSNGLDATTEGDQGYGKISELGTDDGTFKVPSLRNIALRAPYMHDGRFGTLDAVVDHYSEHVQPSPNLGPPFFAQDGAVTQIQMNNEEKEALVAFLKTLSDTTIGSDPKFSDPFPASAAGTN